MITFKELVSQLDEKRGLWDNIHAKRERIKNGSGERMRKPGSKGAPSAADFKAAAESFEYHFEVLEEAVKSIDKGEYDYEGQMARTQLQTILRNSKDLVDMLSDEENMPEWVQSKITLAQDYITCVRDYLQSREELEESSWVKQAATAIAMKKAGKKPKNEELDAQFDLIEDMVQDLSAQYNIDEDTIWEELETVDDKELLEAAVDAKGHKSSTGGLTQKGRDYYNNKYGSHLKAPVTKKPSELKKGSKAYNRRKSFCARMSGVEGPMTKPNGEPSRKALALRKWNC
jgi:hypothetical protein